MKKIVHYSPVSRVLLSLLILSSLTYLLWWFLPGRAGNPWLYSILVLGEIYHVLMTLLFIYTLWPGDKKLDLHEEKNQNLSIAIFITVAGEPVDVVEKTAQAAKAINYKNKKVYILNDGFVAKKDNWQDIENLAIRLGVNCITRKTPGGAKAGNVNNALKQTNSDLVAVFDADMVPHSDFLEKTLPFFTDPKVGFVQTPQFYKNHRLNEVTKGSWEQQDLFFGPIMNGKNKSNASFICGTNVVIRKTALMEAGGMDEVNIAEDFLTSQMIHRNGWCSHYVSEVLVEGLAPEDLLSYYKQQLRWARGSIEVLFSYNPLFSGLKFPQKIEYLSSSLFYLNGAITALDGIMPLIFFYTGLQPVSISTTNFALFFLPFITLVMVILSTVSSSELTFRAMAFTHSSWIIHLQALYSIITKQKMGFSVTPKKAVEGNFLSLAYPHLTYIFLLVTGTAFSLYQHRYLPAIMTNIAWGAINVAFFIPYIRASYNFKKVNA